MSESTTAEPVKKHPGKVGISFRLLTCVTFLFLLAFGVCTFFTQHTFKKLYTPVAVDRYVTATEHLRDDLEAYLCGSDTVEELRRCNAMRARGHSDSLRSRIARFQEEVASIAGLEVVTRRGGRQMDSRTSVAIASAEKGTIYYSSDNNRIGKRLPDASKNSQISDVVSYDEAGETYVISLPLYDSNDIKLGMMTVSMEAQFVTRITESLLNRHLEPIKIVLAVCLLILLIGTLLMLPARVSVETLPKRKLTSLMLLLVVISQLAVCTVWMDLLRHQHNEAAKTRADDLASWVRQDIEVQLRGGTSLETAANAMLSSSTPVVGWTSALRRGQVYSLQTPEGRQVAQFVHTHREYLAFRTGADDGHVVAAGTGTLMIPLVRNGETVGQLVTQFEMASLRDEMLTVAVDVLIATVISILCLVELLILCFKYMETALVRDTRPEDMDLESKPMGPVHYSIMRPTIFLFLFGVDFSAVLIPLQMENLYEPILGLPRDFIIALPVTAMFFSVGITFLVAGAWMDRRGWNEPFITGVVLTGACKLYAWLAPDALHFIVAMGGVGFGYGLALMAAQGFVMANTRDSQKAHGIAYFFAGVYAGNIGGLAIGAMVAEHIDYQHIFLIGSLFIFASLAFALKFLRPAFQSPDSIDLNQSAARFTGRTFLRFVADRNVLSLVLFCSVPAAIAMIGFLHFFSPIYLNRLGVSESLIGGVLMMYGISLVYLSPLVSRLIDRTERKDLFIALGCALGAVGFISFGVLEGIAAALTAVFFLGLSGSCLQSSQTAYTLKLRATQELGTGKGVAYVRATSRLGQMLGPIVFSYFVMAPDTEDAVKDFGLVYLAVALMFILFSKRESGPNAAPVPETGRPAKLAEAGSD